MVISHDCDLVNDDLDVEPEVEIIVGSVDLEPNGNFRWGKAPRTLHLDYVRAGAPAWVELRATRKSKVRKVALAGYTPDARYELSASNRRLLQSWLAARYRRSAFPDAFLQRMNETKMTERVAKVLNQYGDIVSAAYFDVDNGEEFDRSDGSVYRLAVVLAYSPGDEPAEVGLRGDAAAVALENAFGSRLFDKKTNEWKAIQLVDCYAVSEDDISVSQAKMLTEWRLEHLSLRAEPPLPGPLPV